MTKTTLTTPTAGLTGSMLISSLLTETCAYTDRSNARKGLIRFATKHGLAPELLEVAGEAPSYRIALKTQPHALDLPSYLRVENRTPLTPAQQAKYAEILAGTKNKPGQAHDWNQPKHIEPGIADALRAQGEKKARTHARLEKAGFVKPQSEQETTMAKKAKKTTKAKKSSSRGSTAQATGKGAAVIAALTTRWTPMSAIVEATGWQKHTARAFISRLRSDSKLKIESEKRGEEQHYRIAA